MHSRYKQTPMVVALSAALGASSTIPAALAQERSALEEVIVTASRRAESVQDIPLNIAAVTGDQLQAARLEDLVDIARTVPGLAVIDEGSRNFNNSIVVRGINTANSGPTGALPYDNAAVATYMGEIPLFVNLRTEDLERVEVLIGPQGTLYGSGTLAGAVRYIPNKPETDDFYGEVRGGIFQNDEADDLSYKTGVTLNIPVTDTFAARLNLDYTDDSGFVDYDYIVREAGVSNPQPDFSNPAEVAANLRSKEDVDTLESTAARVALRWQPNERFDSVLSYWYQEQKSGGRTVTHQNAMAHLVDIGDYTSALRFEEPLERETHLASLEIVADLGFAELTSATGISKIDEEGQRDQTDLLLDFEYGYEEFPSFAAFTAEDVDYDNFVQELRLVSQNDGGFNWIIGAFYNKVEEKQISEEFTPGVDLFYIEEFGLDPANTRPDNLEYYELKDRERTEKALFGEIEYALEKWTFTLGARYYEFDEESTQGFDLPLARTVFDGDDPNSVAPDLDTADTDDDGTLFKVNVSYTPTDDLLFYGTVSEGYRIGGVNAIVECTGNETEQEQNLCALPNEILIEPDETTNYELGMRSTWLDQRLVLNAALYLVEWDKIQIPGVTENGNLTIIKNGGEAESKGIELSFTSYLTEDLSLSGNYSYNKAELTEDAPNLVRGDDALDGDRLSGSPENTFALSVDYRWALAGGNELTLNYTTYYTGDTYSTVGLRGNSDIVDRNGTIMPEGWGEESDDFWLHNISAMLQTGNLHTMLYVDNLANEDAVTSYRTDLSELRDLGTNNFALRSYGRYLTTPRTYGVRLRYEF